MAEEDRQGKANAASKSSDNGGKLLFAISSLDEFLSVKKIAAILIVLLILTVAALFIAFFESSFIQALDMRKPAGVLLAFTLFLSILYAFIFFASVMYRWQLMALHDVQFARYLKSEIDHKTPKLFSVWVLPVVSILLVLAAQIVTFSEPASITTDSSVGNYIPYMLAFTFATSVVLLMIGMELSFLAQDHSINNRWIVLVTASLILDFISYFVLIVGLERPDPNTNNLGSAKVAFTFLLGAASLISSYFTLAQARMWSEVFSTTDKKEND